MLLVLSSLAFPCAGFVHGEGVELDSPAQEAIFRVEAGVATVEYLAEFRGETEDFGWVIVLPGTFSTLEEGDKTTFDELRAWTDPQVYEESEDEGGRSCGCTDQALSKGDGANDLGDRGGVDVVAEGYTGTYSYQVVEATDPTALQDWLDENGWESDEIAEPVAQYVEEGGAQFVLVRLDNDITMDPEVTYQLPPVRIAYAGDLTFPSRMALGAEVDFVHTRVYAIGEEAASVTGWSEAAAPTFSAATSEEAATQWEAALQAAGERREMIRVWSGDYDGAWVTRYETMAPPAAHTADATFTFDGGQAYTSTEIWLSSASAAVLLLPLAGLWMGRRRRVS